jgi:hypothetical protein
MGQSITNTDRHLSTYSSEDEQQQQHKKHLSTGGDLSAILEDAAIGGHQAPDVLYKMQMCFTGLECVGEVIAYNV